MNDKENKILNDSFNGINDYCNEFLEYTRDIEQDKNFISRKRVDFFIRNLKFMLEQTRIDLEQEQK